MCVIVKRNNKVMNPRGHKPNVLPRPPCQCWCLCYSSRLGFFFPYFDFVEFVLSSHVIPVQEGKLQWAKRKMVMLGGKLLDPPCS